MERRNTIQKDLVLKTVQGLKRHLTAEEVYEFIKKDHPTIGKGTVYRNLGILAEEAKFCLRQSRSPGRTGPVRLYAEKSLPCRVHPVRRSFRCRYG